MFWSIALASPPTIAVERSLCAAWSIEVEQPGEEVTLWIDGERVATGPSPLRIDWRPRSPTLQLEARGRGPRTRSTVSTPPADLYVETRTPRRGEVQVAAHFGCPDLALATLTVNGVEEKARIGRWKRFELAEGGLVRVEGVATIGGTVVARHVHTVQVQPACEVDEDEDGTCADEDCDDLNPAVHPGAWDAAGDGLDNDCDGHLAGDLDRDGHDASSDCAPRDPSRWRYATGYPDRDGDGVGRPVAGRLRDCADRVAPVQGDCDDDDPERYPGAVERNDGKDNDCDGAFSPEERQSHFQPVKIGDSTWKLPADQGPPGPLLHTFRAGASTCVVFDGHGSVAALGQKGQSWRTPSVACGQDGVLWAVGSVETRGMLHARYDFTDGTPRTSGAWTELEPLPDGFVTDAIRWTVDQGELVTVPPRSRPTMIERQGDCIRNVSGRTLHPGELVLRGMQVGGHPAEQITDRGPTYRHAPLFEPTPDGGCVAVEAIEIDFLDQMELRAGGRTLLLLGDP